MKKSSSMHQFFLIIIVSIVFMAGNVRYAVCQPAPAATPPATFKQDGVEVKAETVLDAMINGRDIELTNCTIEGPIDFTNLADESKYISTDSLIKELDAVKQKITAAETPETNDVQEMDRLNTIVGHMKRIQSKLPGKKVKILEIKGSIKISSNSTIKDIIKCSTKNEDIIVVFNEDVNLNRTIFNDTVEFKNALFMGRFLSQFSTFEENADFENTRFLDKVFFYKSSFKDDAFFTNASFKGITNFQDTKFSKKPYFKNTSLSSIVHPDDLVEEAIEIRKTNMNKQLIIDRLRHKYSDKDYKFGQVSLDEGEVKRLYEAGYDDEFIRQLEGVPSVVTLAPAFVWLGESQSGVGAVIIRVNLKPDPAKDHPFYHLVKLNIGMTVEPVDEKKEGTTDTVSTTFYLLGGSYQINRHALFNVGLAVPSTRDLQVGEQFYAGFTIDTDLLEIFK
jgi:hypothetical protein